MAKLSFNHLRPCWVFNGDYYIKGLFHCWRTESYVLPPSPLRGGHSGGQVSEVTALVEMEDGTIRAIPFGQVTFCDSCGKFSELNFGEPPALTGR